MAGTGAFALDDDQRRAVESDALSLRVLAGAGAGKTRVLTQRVARRIADESVDPAHTLVLTFTRKAADELRERLRGTAREGDARVVTGTFHAVAYAQLRRRWLDQGRSVPVVVSQPAWLLGNVLDSLRLSRVTNPRTIASEISWAKSRRLVPQSYVEATERFRRRPPVSSAQMERIYAAYEAEKKKRRTVDYDDLLLLLTDALNNDKSFYATQSWQFRHFFVDEFQDLNLAQFQLLRAWLGDREDLFVVGDPNQAIYGWNGADSSYLNSLEKYYPKLETVRLGTNYRSSKNVLAAAHALMSDATTPALDAESGALPKVREFDSEQHEAEGIARAVRDAHHRNYRWSDIAILVRTNAQRAEIELALDDLEIPYRAAGGASWLYGPEIRSALEYLRESASLLLNQRVPDLDEMVADATETERSYLEQLQMAMKSCLAADPEITVGDFLSWVEVGSRQDAPVVTAARSGAVTVATFHRAKGLEWPVVFLAGLEDGFVPIGNNDVDEEKRLFYVAITRAREELHCSYTHKRTVGNAVVERTPSPWLSVLRAAAKSEPATPPEKVHKAISSGRESLHAEPEQPDPVRVALEKWRESRAKMSGIDAHLILDDATLNELVRLRPNSRDELAAVEGIGAVRAAAVGDELIRLWQNE